MGYPVPRGRRNAASSGRGPAKSAPAGGVQRSGAVAVPTLPGIGRPEPAASDGRPDPGLHAVLAAQLDEGLRALALDVSGSVQGALLAYLALLQKWNRVYNLTAIRDPQAMLVQHLLDSLAVVPALQRRWSATGPGPVLADIGSGAGLPAIPMALAWPQVRYTLVEPVEKKAAFLRQAVGDLGLTERVQVVCQRVQDMGPAGPFDFITCRAYATLAAFAEDVQAIAGAQTTLVALKGVRPDAETGALGAPWAVDEIEVLSVPFLNAHRHLVWMRRV
jgi:16S rRNA (guanine527-N7)-methyltransferase